MPPKSIDAKIKANLATQEKLKRELVELKQEKVKRAKAERQRLERKLGRLALQYELHLLSEDQLAAVLQKARLEVLDLPQHGVSQRDAVTRDEESHSDAAQVGV